MPEQVKDQKEQEVKQDLTLTLRTSGYPTVVLKATKCDEKMMVDLKVKKDEDGNVVPDESNLIDLDALIQTYKDQCGMEAAKRLLKLGQAQPEDFADDGKSGLDCTVIPESAQDRANAAVAAKAQADAVKQKFGIPTDQDLTQEQFENLIKSYISANPDKFIKPAETKPAGGNE